MEDAVMNAGWEYRGFKEYPVGLGGEGRKHKCSRCGKLIRRDEKQVMAYGIVKKYYPIRGLTGFERRMWFHDACRYGTPGGCAP
jgi:hypothetical protein